MVRSIQAHFILVFTGWLWLVATPQAVAEQPAPQAPTDDRSAQQRDEAIGIADFGLEEQIHSAIDLVGPEQGSAGRNRTLLAQRVQCWIDGIERCSFADLNDPRVRAVRRFLGRGPADRDGAVQVRFPDSTWIEVRLVRATDPGPDTLKQSAYAPVVLPSTAQAPDLATIPTQSVQFEGIVYEGGAEVRAALERLKRRLEVPELPAFALPAAEFSVD